MNAREAFPRRAGSGAPDIPIPEIVGRLTGNINALAQHLLPNGHCDGPEWRCGSIQGEPGNSLGVHLTGAKAGVWCDFEDGTKGDPLDLIQACLGIDKGGAVTWAKGWLGIDENDSAPSLQPRPRPQINEAPRQDNPNQAHALSIWHASVPAENTPGKHYLLGRGYTGPIPPTIKFHAALLHPDIGQHLPALVAAVANVERKIIGITRIYLTLTGRKAPLNRPKLALGALRGGAVRLAPTTDRVWLTEGVEDGLACMQMLGEPTWAMLGTAGFKTVELPDHIRQVILAPDGDDAGQAVIEEAARRLMARGHEVRAAKLPDGKDWCDLLDDYEEHAGILEFDFEQINLSAEALARRETIDGR